MSRNGVITAIVLLSCLGVNLNFVSASGTVSVEIAGYNDPNSDDRNDFYVFTSFGLYPVSYEITLKQPNTRDIVHESRSHEQGPHILRFKKWTGTLSCHVAIKVMRYGNTFLDKRFFTYDFRREIHVGVADRKTEFTLFDSKYIRISSDHFRRYARSLKLYIRVTCDRFYFGADCSRHCRAQGRPRGHYACTADGHKGCRPNWRRAAANCTEPDPCRPSRCRNGAVCVETPGANFVCRCPRAFRGRLCEVPRSRCELAGLCRNGGVCAETPGANFVCRCPRAFSGRLCEVPRSPCELAGPCRNGGHCVNINGAAVCRCPGPRCQISAARHDGRAVSPERRSGVVFAALLFAAAAAVVVVVVVGLLRWRRAQRRAVCRPPLPLQVGRRSGSDERVSSFETTTTAP